MARSITGVVSSKAGNKSIVVMVRASKIHSLYRKRYTRTSKFMAHDEKNEAGVGDQVIIVETRPLSARKRFSLDKILTKAGIQFKDEDATADIVQESPIDQSPSPTPEASVSKEPPVKAKKAKATPAAKAKPKAENSAAKLSEKVSEDKQ